MTLTITPDEIKLLRQALKIVRNSAICGPDVTYLTGEGNGTPKNYRKYSRDIKKCDRDLAMSRDLLKRLR